MPERSIDAPESPVRKVEFGFGGIFFGLVIVAVAIFGLNYFNIINLPFNLPHQQVSQKKTFQVTAEILPESQKISSVLQTKAEKAGYKIIWQGDSSDITGRTVLASVGRIFPQGSESFGFTEEQFRIIGLFKSFKSISNSNDKYIILKDPVENTETKIRIISKIDTFNNTVKHFSRFYADDLNLSPYMDTDTSKLLFDFDKTKLSDLSKLIKIGDVILVQINGNTVRSASGSASMETNFLKDESGMFEAAFVTLRRFGGKNQLESEQANEK